MLNKNTKFVFFFYTMNINYTKFLIFNKIIILIKKIKSEVFAL